MREGQDGVHRSRVQDIRRFEPPFPRDVDAHLHAIEPSRRVCVGPDLDGCAMLFRLLATAPVEIEAAGISVQLQGNAAVGGLLDDGVDVHLLRLAREQ